MNVDKISELIVCPFCNSDLSENSHRCIKCGAEKVRGHINSRERRKINILRTLLILVLGIYFYYFYPLSGSFLFAASLVVISFILSMFIPHYIFKLKNRQNIIWKRKNIPL